MSKPASILIAKMQRLEDMPEQERAVVRKFLFGGIAGLNEQHEKRWRRMWSRILKAEVGEVFDLELKVTRSGKFHRRCMAVEQMLFDRQERWATIEAMRLWLKTGAMWGDYQLNTRGVMKFVPRSRSYEECSDDQMREVDHGIRNFLRTPLAQRRMWPHLSIDQRHEMMEAILEPQEEQTT